MAEEQEKTEAPSSHKIQKAREEGNVAKSPEIVGFIGLLVGLLSIFVIFPFWLKNFQAIYIQALQWGNTDFTKENIFNLLLGLLGNILMMILPIFLALMIAGVLGNIGQFGFLLSTKAISPKLSKINPISGAKNLFSIKKLLDGVMITLKVFIAFLVGFFIFASFLGDLEHIALFNVFDQMIWFRNKAIILILALLLLFFVMALADFIIKKRQYTKSLRMSKQEVKDEYKQQEGNPEIRAKIRQMMMKNSMSKMMNAIPSANVVVTNPTHYAIALRFGKLDPAPVVVAKGTDHLAIRIKGIAREHEIEIIENPKLARELYKEVDIDEPIPRTLFQAVAILFAEVAKIQQQKGKKFL
ncbi:flagellar biosynthesis protein FlhB [Helicobacter cappadocius]|uniref:Flagellar biosynthetic protein FlhB n=1 Tax=Helicobacter cappadocius TaxID=3063998 RepID=A0AA90PJC5_9HELI|nr:MULTISPECIES: flagellar biosynthesis protein FlhB [unclassified Helicobacter]MDO7252402.1 flagellar biosynthesis protein FlhB [Helicobacter sp. faydin-H75]MDP2538269.1 flagellar biosynthesis protein FlhB [Helicobacter sp. faydin-H76]